MRSMGGTGLEEHRRAGLAHYRSLLLRWSCQVSHHPPIVALHAEGQGWLYDEEMSVQSSLGATGLRLVPDGYVKVIISR